MAMKCDVRVEEEVKAVFAAAFNKFGGVDVCVNNAGVGHNTTLLTGDTAEWRDMVEVCMVYIDTLQSITIPSLFCQS